MSSKLIARKSGLILLMVMAGWAICGRSYADTVHGSDGAGFQRWFTTTDLNNTLNDNGAPYWDYPTQYRVTNDIFPPGFPPVVTDPPGQHANVGYCLTGTGNCLTEFLKTAGAPDLPPGPIPFWGMPYDSVADTGGALDRQVFFEKDTPNQLQATLELQLSESADEINEFGWFEYNPANPEDSRLGQLHPLFFGSLNGGTPSSIGTMMNFLPTKYYGYYFIDTSESGCGPILTVIDLNPGPSHICTQPNFLHTLAIFATDPESPFSTFWIAGLNPPIECQNADCNQTLVRVQPLPVKNRNPDPAVVSRSWWKK